MSYQLHYAKRYDVKFEGAAFIDVEAWDNLFYARFYDNGWTNESHEYEVHRDDIKLYIKELKLERPEAKSLYFTDMTHAQEIAALEELLKSEDELIRVEWF